jgi:pimeloyl-ACP methyl ester carboxylesterase
MNIPGLRTHDFMPRRATALGILLAVALAAGAAPATAEDFDRDPVFFVHGHGLGSSDWQSLVNTLVAHGYPPEFLRAIDLVPNTGGNRAAAETQIAPAIETFLADVNAFLEASGYAGAPKRRVDLVAHSMGAVSTRYYAAVVAPQRVDTWIALGGANHGTDALCPFVGFDEGGAAELCPAYSTDPADSVQLTLNGPPGGGVDETPFGLGVDAADVADIAPDDERRIFYATIRTEDDQWIVPGNSALVDGAGGRPVALPDGFPAVETAPGNFLMTDGVTHDSLPGDWWVQQLVVLLLDAADPPPAPGRIEGRGHVDTAEARHHFGFRVAEHVDGAEAGRLAYRLERRGTGPRADRFVSTALTAVRFSVDPTLSPERPPEARVDSVVFSGVGRWNDTPGYTFEASAGDGGEPGGECDEFALTITAPDGAVVVRVTGRLAGGNVRARR